MKIIILGSNGQIGWELQRSLSILGTLYCFDRPTIDLQDTNALHNSINDIDPEVIINAAAYTAVDLAETETATADYFNTQLPQLLAKIAKERDALLIHYSTDYVYSGNKRTPYIESDNAEPLSIYGKTKYLGDLAIQDSGCKHIIFRTSWVYAARGSNFIKTMLQLAQTKDQLNVVQDQIGSPTSAELIADVTALCLNTIQHSQTPKNYYGLYHLTASGTTNWHEFAQHIITRATNAGLKIKIDSRKVTPINTYEYPTAATRPMYSILNTTKLQKKFQLVIPDWTTGVDRTLDEIFLQTNQPHNPEN